MPFFLQPQGAPYCQRWYFVSSTARKQIHRVMGRDDVSLVSGSHRLFFIETLRYLQSQSVQSQ